MHLWMHKFVIKIGDEDNGVAKGTAFEALPDDWVCPICFAGKDEFELDK